MDISIKILKILLLLISVYFWNRYIIKNMFKIIIGFHRKFNTINMNRIPIQFLIQNERKFYIFSALFFWIGAAFISYDILLNE